MGNVEISSIQKNYNIVLCFQFSSQEVTRILVLVVLVGNGLHLREKKRKTKADTTSKDW